MAGAGGAALAALGAAWTGPDSESAAGVRLPEDQPCDVRVLYDTWLWYERATFGLCGLVFGAPFLLGTHLLALAPLQLVGAVRGLAPPCDSWLCDIFP